MALDAERGNELGETEKASQIWVGMSKERKDRKNMYIDTRHPLKCKRCWRMESLKIPEELLGS